MFGKSTQTRVADTLTAITNSNNLNVNARNAIIAMINARFPRLTPQNRQDFDQLSHGMSVKANIPNAAARGNTAERELRRAIFLIWKSIGQPLGDQQMTNAKAAAAMTMGVGLLPAALSDAMYKAAVVASPASALAAFNDLSTHPVRFISTHKIMIFGSIAGRDKFTAPGASYQNFFTFHFCYNGERDRFEFNLFAPPAYGASYPVVNAISVPALHWSLVHNVGASPGDFTGLLGCELTGSSIMLTTQFTGCAFCLTNHGGMFRAAHISPAGDVNRQNYIGMGNALATRLVNQPAAMANAAGAPVMIFGNGAGNMPVHGGGNSFYPPKTPNAAAGQMSYVSIFAVNKNNNGWRFYTQAIDGAAQIMAADTRRIF